MRLNLTRKISEDIHQSLKNIFCLFDEFCKQNGIFYDIVCDEPVKQGYLIPKKDIRSLYDHIIPHAERNNILIDLDQNRKDGSLFTFSLAAITDDGHWQALKGKTNKAKRKEMTIFADPKSAEKVDNGTALGMKNHKINESAKSATPPNKIKGVNSGSSVPVQIELGAEIDGDRSPMSPGEPKRKPMSYNKRLNAYDNPTDVAELQSYKRPVIERALVGTKLGHVQDPNINTKHRSIIPPITPDPSGEQENPLTGSIDQNSIPFEPKADDNEDLLDPLVENPKQEITMAPITDFPNNKEFNNQEPPDSIRNMDEPWVIGGGHMTAIPPTTSVGDSQPISNVVSEPEHGGVGAFYPPKTINRKKPPLTWPGKKHVLNI